MTISDIVTRYNEFNHLRLIAGNAGDIAPLIPFFIMDAGYQYYCRYILPLPLKQEAKQARTKWSEAYRAFNRRFTAAFNADEREEVNGIMDEFQEFITHDMELAWINGTNCFCEAFDISEQQILAGIMMTNQLAVDAQLIWRQMHRHDSPDINGVLQWSKTTAEYYMYSKGHTECRIPDRKVSQLEKCEQALMRKIIRWVENKNKENESKNQETE